MPLRQIVQYTLHFPLPRGYSCPRNQFHQSLSRGRLRKICINNVKNSPLLANTFRIFVFFCLVLPQNTLGDPVNVLPRHVSAIHHTFMYIHAFYMHNSEKDGIFMYKALHSVHGKATIPRYIPHFAPVNLAVHPWRTMQTRSFLLFFVTFDGYCSENTFYGRFRQPAFCHFRTKCPATGRRISPADPLPSF